MNCLSQATKEKGLKICTLTLCTHLPQWTLEHVKQTHGLLFDRHTVKDFKKVSNELSLILQLYNTS